MASKGLKEVIGCGSKGLREVIGCGLYRAKGGDRLWAVQGYER